MRAVVATYVARCLYTEQLFQLTGRIVLARLEECNRTLWVFVLHRIYNENTLFQVLRTKQTALQ
jgi:hypothetical protein